MEEETNKLVNPFLGYKPPFIFDGYSYIDTDEGSMALQGDYEDRELLKKIESILNKTEKGCFKVIGTKELDPCALQVDGKWLTIRGWGHLTGTGAMNLDEQEAMRLQDAFRDWLISKLKGEESPYDVYYQEAHDRIIPEPDPEPEPERPPVKKQIWYLEEGEPEPDLWSTAEFEFVRVPKGWKRKHGMSGTVKQPFYVQFLRKRRKKR